MDTFPRQKAKLHKSHLTSLIYTFLPNKHLIRQEKYKKLQNFYQSAKKAEFPGGKRYKD